MAATAAILDLVTPKINSNLPTHPMIDLWKFRDNPSKRSQVMVRKRKIQDGRHGGHFEFGDAQNQ